MFWRGQQKQTKILLKNRHSAEGENIMAKGYKKQD